ncbi:MAG: phenylalanine--tRNA ligase beta subunit-related protein [Methanomassiliicoccales archaeon]|nr:phenylalanine--tRNA ligase beta subunit-related protein [Methanomassiliicoccales archaeon]
MKLQFSGEIETRFPPFRVIVESITNVNVARYSEELEEFKESVLQEVRNEYTLDELKNRPLFKAYRDFFWKIGIDPTKIRPASEALIRRVLQNKPIPSVNALVDAYNLASIRSGIPLAAFDKRTVEGDLYMRFAKKGEQFLGIGMKEPIELTGNEIVVSDSKKLIAIYPYRDSDATKVTENTKDIILMVCGVPGISDDLLEKAKLISLSYIMKFCGGSRN